MRGQDLRHCRPPVRASILARASRCRPWIVQPERIAVDEGSGLSERRDDAGRGGRVPVWDRGFLFGDAVYEVFRMYRGRRWLEPEHLARLRRSLTELDFGPYELERLIERMDRTVAASEIREGTVYVQITRGVAPRSHAFPDPSVPPTELIVVRPYDDGPAARLRQQGARMISQPDLRWKRCDIKSTNLLANVLALRIRSPRRLR